MIKTIKVLLVCFILSSGMVFGMRPICRAIASDINDALWEGDLELAVTLSQIYDNLGCGNDP